MMKGILFDSYIEMRSRRIGVIFGVITVLASMAAIAMNSVDLSLTIDGQSSENPFAAWGMTFLDNYFTVLGALAVFAVAGLFPAMMQRGRAEFYLSKPISRHTLFTFRFSSIFVVYGTLILFSGLISYAVFTFFASVGGFSFLWVAGSHILIFLVWLTLVTLSGVLFNSGGVAMMIAFFTWIAQLWLRYYDGLKLFESDIPYYIGMGLYYIVPKTSQMAEIGVSLAAGNPVESWMPLWSTALFTLGAFWLALILFRRKDY